MPNEMIEMQKGLRKADRKAELLGRDMSNLLRGIAFMESNGDRSSGNYFYHQEELKKVLAKKNQLTRREILEEFEPRFKKEQEASASQMAVTRAVAGDIAKEKGTRRVEMDDDFMKRLSKLRDNVTTGSKRTRGAGTPKCLRFMQ